MLYRETPAPVPLDQWVRCFWTLTADTPDPQPIVPDGRLEIVLHRAEPFGRVLEGGAVQAQSPIMVAGQLTGPIHLSPRGPVDIIGIRFRTAGARDLLRLRLGDLVDRVIPLDDVDPGLTAMLERASRDTDPIGALTTVLLDRMRSHGHRASPAAVARLAGGEAVAAVARSLGVSVRTLERRVLDDAGLPPKVLQRVMRFRTLYAMLQGGRGTWARAAARAGYFDQTHANRDFRQFAGESPSRHFERQADLARAILSDSS